MVRIATMVSVLLLIVHPARAQDLLFEGTKQLGAIGQFGRTLGPAPALVHHPLVDGGRFVIDGDVATDWQAGTSVALGPGFVVGFDRARPRVFMARHDGVWGVDFVTGIALLVLEGPTVDLVACAHAYSANVPFCVFTRPGGEQEIFKPGSQGPERVLLTRFASIAPLNWVVTPDATRIYFERCADLAPAPGAYCVESDIAMLDLRTGLLTTIANDTPIERVGTLQWDEVDERLIAVGPRIDVYTRDLRPLVSATVGGRCRQLALSPHSGRLYLNVVEDSSFPESTLTAFDPMTYRTLAPAATRSGGYSCGPLTVLTAPGAPKAVQAAIAGDTVVLAWTNIGAASEFVLDVGFAPSRTDLSMNLGPDTRATFRDVPRGTYYLRLRGGNTFGGGKPSAEVAITVR
jgi:hypothetical protein